jgi:hypothetical protein
MSESAEPKIESPTPCSPAIQKDAKLLARLVVLEGKPFKSSAIAAGYAAATAHKGQKWLCGVSADVSTAFAAETSALTTRRLTELKPLAVKRLQAEIADPKSVAGMKAIELAGRFKENDWFVKSGDVQVGVMAVLGDSQALDSAKNNIQAYIDSEPVEKQE